MLEAIHSYASEGDITSLLQALEQGIPIDLEGILLFSFLYLS
jgi:hypothetical protein